MNGFSPEPNCAEVFMKILAVEDEPEYLEMLREVLSEIGHSITTATNGVEALKVLEHEKVDVILADVAMPTMDGITFHETLRSKPEFARTPFIFLTGVNNLKEVRAVCRPECDMLLQKPFPVDQLLRIFAGKFI
jgi:CheY-like chemotaxis protein